MPEHRALMKPLGRTIRCALAALTWSATIFAAEPLKTDIVYGEAGGEKLKLDVSVPEGDGPFPIAILVHGGGWSAGDKSGSNKPGDSADITPWFAPLTAAHFTWFSINYRLAPKNPWPAQSEDLKAAIRWVKAHASEFKGDTNRMALLGHSAGGHLVAFVATSREPDVRVQAVVGCAAVSDLVADSERRGGISNSLRMLTGRGEELNPESRARLGDMSPIHLVHSAMPPILLIQGDADKTVPLSQSVAFRTRLLESHVPCELMIIPGAPHRLLDWEKFDPAFGSKITAWLLRTLNLPPQDNSFAPKM